MKSIDISTLVSNNKNIVRIEADGNYSRIIYTNETQLLCKTLKKVSLQLKDDKFFRIHHKHLVNLRFIVHFSKDVIFLRNGEILKISRRKSKQVLFQLEKDIKHASI